MRCVLTRLRSYVLGRRLAGLTTVVSHEIKTFAVVLFVSQDTISQTGGLGTFLTSTAVD